MARPPRTELRADELERRYAPANLLSYTAPSGNGADVITVRLDAAGKKLQILDDGVQVASRNLSTTDAVAITAAAGENDSLVVDYTGFFTVPVTFNGGASGAKATVAGLGGNKTVSLNFGASAVGVEADIGGDDPTTLRVETALVDFANGSGAYTGAGRVSVVAGTVSEFVGTSQADVMIDHTSYSGLGLNGGLGDDTYFLDAGSTITVTDDGGTDAVSFANSTDAITATMTDSGGTVEDTSHDLVFIFGGLEAITGSAFGDTFVDAGHVTSAYNGGLGDDTYFLDAGSTITVTDDGGTDTVNFKNSADTITAVLGDAPANPLDPWSTVVDSGGDEVNIFGSMEGVVGTEGVDSITGNSAANRIEGGEGDDTLDGGAGDDVYVETPGSDDVIVDSGGVDTIDFSGANYGITLDLNLTGGQWQTVDTAGNRVALFGTIENVIGSRFADNVTGNSANNLLRGGDGDDRLVGGPGKDILVGGNGADRLNGSSDQDLLIGGTTAYDTGPLSGAAWAAIQGVWVGAGTIQQRVTTLNNASAAYHLRATGPSATVFDDGEADVLTGSQSADWYFASVTDTITDKDNQEFVNDLP